ncbi:MAG: glycerol-3-phosphate acyltransferase, partial [Desulfovibrionaceae bacterium]|nr:glycerol-3-phosphate acyltransferase [Desulfovibrionaceae bacterium]
MAEFFWIICAYLLGAVPYGLVIGRTFCGVDPRTAGSHNVGATNVARLCGFPWGVATLACDILKGALPVWAALHINQSAVFVTLVALAAVLGLGLRRI